MLLDIKVQELTKPRVPLLVASLVIPFLFMVQLAGVLQKTEDTAAPPLALEKAAVHFQNDAVENPSTIEQQLGEGKLPDVHLIGNTLFTRFNFPLQVVGVLLLVATVGVVALSKKGSDRDPVTPDKN